MNGINNLLDNTTAYTIYSMDALNSNIIYLLDDFILKKTKLSMYARCWATHTTQSISDFYRNSTMSNTLDKLVTELFIASPVLVTIWKGEGVYEKLTAIKGKSHPKAANENSIRGTFLCDNSICNLIHTPDSLEEAKRELSLLIDFSINKLVIVDNALKKSTDTSSVIINHSGIVMLHRAISRLLFNQSITPIKYNNALLRKKSVGFYNEACELVYKLSNYENLYVNNIIYIYFNADYEQMGYEFKNKAFPLNSWEKFVLLCGLACVDKWKEL
jgi:nucleoside diphosphate kinase